MAEYEVGDTIYEFPDEMSEEEVLAVLREHQIIPPVRGAQLVEFEGVVYEFPDDATDEEIFSFLDETSPQADRFPALNQPEEVLPLAAGAALLGAASWVLARRTLLASRPTLKRKGLFRKKSSWACTRCGETLTLGQESCGSCGQPQKWPGYLRR